MTKYTPEIREYIERHCTGTSYQEMADQLNRMYGTSYTKVQMRSYYKNHKLKSGLTGQFTKGHEPFNKGMAWKEFLSREAQANCRKTQYKKGNMPHNHKPIGHERISKDGYVEVKVREKEPGEYGNKNFVLKHRFIWEQAHGPIPKGCDIGFRDGNKQNCTLENLFLMTRAQNAAMNHLKFRSTDPDAVETSLLLADISLTKAKRKKKGMKQK